MQEFKTKNAKVIEDDKSESTESLQPIYQQITKKKKAKRIYKIAE